MSLNEKAWDNKWRLVIYDIPYRQRNKSDAFRRLSKKMDFLPVQKSAYLTPHPCQKEINFLRTFYSLEDYVSVLVVSGIENEQAYRKYFGV